MGIDWKLLLAQIINFVVLLFVLHKFLYKPVIKILEDRERKIEISLKQADEIKKNLSKSEADREKVVSEARNEAGKIINDAKKTSEKIREELTNQAKVEAASILEQGKRQLAADKEAMFKELKADVADVVKAATEKILRQKLDAEADRKIIKETLQNI